MTITVPDLAKLAEHLDIIETLAAWTPSKIDDSIVRILKLAAGDPVILQGLADFLNWTQLFASDHTTLITPEPELPGCLEVERKAIEQWRSYLKAT